MAVGSRKYFNIIPIFDQCFVNSIKHKIIVKHEESLNPQCVAGEINMCLYN